MSGRNISLGKKAGADFEMLRKRTLESKNEDSDSTFLPKNKEQRNSSEYQCDFDNRPQETETFEDENANLFHKIVRDEGAKACLDEYIHETNVQLQNPTFDIKVCVNHFADKLQNYWDDTVKGETTCYLYEGSKVSTNSLARGLSNLFDDKGIALNHQKDILNILHNAFGEKINLPVKILQKHKKAVDHVDDDNDDDGDVDDHEDCKSAWSMNTDDLLTPSVNVDLKRFSTERPRCVGFDQCVNDCYVYAGNENYEKFCCPECGANRFQPCSRSTCVGHGTSTCAHLLEGDGISQKKLWYRPILLLIMDLLKTPYFLTALNYKRKRLVGDNEFYSDFLDGELPQRHLNEMRERFELYSDSKRSSSADESSIKSVTILFSEFYDGAQLFKRKASDFWPLCLSIMNLPPVYRGKLGIGFFLLALYAGKHKNAEHFLFSDCVCEELRMLYDGVERTIDGQTYFIQARLIFHVLDTKAAEPILAIQSWSTSRNGCPLCQLITGTHNSVKVCFIGHRHLLQPNHYLRFFGQSGLCCPKSFYLPDTKDSWFSETFISDQKPIILTEQLSNEKNQGRRRNMCKPCVVSEGSWTEENILDFCKSKVDTYYWNHKGLYDFKDFVMKESGKANQTLKSLKSFLFYRHFDLRPYRQYTRISSEDHLIYARSAQQLNMNWRKGPKENVHGYQDVWVFNKLQYGNIESIEWPFVHATTGIELNLNKMIFGEIKTKSTRRSNKPIVEKGGISISKKPKEEAEKVCPPYRPNESPWEATTDDKRRCRAWLSCILLPPGGDDTWDLRSFILSEGKLGASKMNQKLKIYTCFLRVILYNFTSLPLAFHWFYLMFADDMKRLQQNMILKEDVVQLSNDIIETVCLAEGLFPSGLITAQMHQLIHMAPMIYKLGPPMGVSEFAGERAIGVLKRRKTNGNPGGRSFERRICVSQVEKEVRDLREFYKVAVSSHQLDLNNKRTFNLDESGVLHYTDRPFGMGKKESSQKRLKLTNIELTDHEFQYFVLALLAELDKYDDREIQNSSMHRLHNIFNAQKQDQHKNTSFHLWLKDVAEAKVVVEEECLRLLSIQLVEMKISFYQTAYIYGVKLKARGSNLRERSASTRDSKGKYLGQNTDLSSWQKKNQYSSWCKFSQKRKNFKEEKYYYGQLNAFFQITLNDSILDRTMLASITAMSFTTSPEPFCLEFVEVGSFIKSPLFVVVSDFLPTAIATIPLDVVDSPIPLPKCNIPKDLVNGPNTYYSKHFITPELYAFKKFVMIILHPEKVSLKPKNTAFKQFLFGE